MKLKLALLGTCAVAMTAGGAVMAQSMMRVGDVTAQTARPGQSTPVASCESLAQQSLPQGRVTAARAVAAGPFTPPQAGPNAPQPVQLPAHCRVAATLTPSSDSDIKMELWLPAQGWNGKFMMVGNGGWNGSITYNAMAEPLRRGYAVASTDTGHEGGRGTFAFDHPEKLIDFAYRAVHETTVKGKQLTTAFYGGAPRYSYWNGCSSGGKQGLKEVQMYPADFDGVIAGAPANNWIRLQTQSLVANMANLPRNGGGQAVLGQSHLTILNRAALAQCDEKDGLKDNQIQDPRTCDFKASSVICRPGQEAGTCLTAEQAAAADRIYAPVRMRSGELVYPGMPVGSEMTWNPVIGRRWDTGADTYALAFNNKDWDFYNLNVDRDVMAAERHPLVGQLMATSPDMSAFKNRGGKIIQYHGWADPFIPTENSINYYESVVAAHGGMQQAQDFHRLFLVPAMGHCNGAYSFDWIRAIEEWVEHGRAPDVVEGQRLPPPGEPVRPPPAGAVVFAPQFGVRPMCVYPNIARQLGGNGEQPVDWMCVPGQRGSRPEHAPQRLGQRIASR